MPLLSRVKIEPGLYTIYELSDVESEDDPVAKSSEECDLMVQRAEEIQTELEVRLKNVEASKIVHTSKPHSFAERKTNPV